ncbi:Tubulin monoglycylase TTLL3 [Holothuria leucospilota]|uniref:Tubulin monoglycylase TTLL3 n=1 Tax=Holothuria leucospilota TaxID=206669 RepID=A0A9Q1CLF2_HOLLE|nr:Tubulin monoglycylase TTLL3 [Holothuria leucospilota]
MTSTSLRTNSRYAGSIGNTSGVGHDEYETELTFAPKLNSTSLRLVEERRNNGREGFYTKTSTEGRIKASSKDDFTFRPQMSETSLKIAQGLGTTFMARQAMHLEKQKKLLEQQAQLPPAKFGRLSPVPLARLRKLKETSDLAWNTPVATPNVSDKDGTLTSSRLGVGSSISMLNPVNHTKATPSFHSSINLQRTSTSGVYSQSAALLLKNRKAVLPKPQGHHKHRRAVTHPSEEKDFRVEDEDIPVLATSIGGTHPTKTSVSPELSPRTKAKQGKAGPTGEKLRIAKMTAEKAIKAKKIFMIQGPYPVVREGLRQRNWVEKQYKRMAPHKFKKKNDSDEDSDDCDDSDDGNDDNDNGCHGDSDDGDEDVGDSDSICGMMSRMVRNITPTFIWTCRNGSIDFKFLRKDAIVNHFEKNGAFTTKSGLCSHLRNLPWYDQVDPDTFFPRCYKICSEDEKIAFLEDYRLSAACAIVKWVVMKHSGELDKDYQEQTDDKATSTVTPGQTSGKPSKPKKPAPSVSTSVLDTAIKIVEDYFSNLEHEDLDKPLSCKDILTEEEWDVFIKQYYQVVHDGGTIEDSMSSYAYCESLLKRLQITKPQLDMQGLRNIWIVKPGAKSRGRGIFCLNKLDELLKLVGNPLVIKEGKWVVQKYIERPLLVYDTKFDIRQWFLVTDWNPLTVWFYRMCYLRFCTQPFSMDNFDASIHLSNQSIQKNYENAVTRSRMLPEENMWDSEEFKAYLDKRGCGNVWEDLVYPGMKKAVVSALLCCQDAVAMRKNSFELYGADFMMTDDFCPWLIEINCSPAMGATTEITERLCAEVIEDTLAVVLDRRKDKDCDIGNFELAYKQHSVHVPIYIGANMVVEGVGVRKPSEVVKRQKSNPNLTGRHPESHTKKEHAASKTKAVRKSTSEETVRSNSASAQATNLEELQKKLAGIALSTDTIEPASVPKYRLPKFKKVKSKKSRSKTNISTSVDYSGGIIREGLKVQEEMQLNAVIMQKLHDLGKVNDMNENNNNHNNGGECEVGEYSVRISQGYGQAWPKRELGAHVKIPYVGRYHIKQSRVPQTTLAAYRKQLKRKKVKLKLHHETSKKDTQEGMVPLAGVMKLTSSI